MRKYLASAALAAVAVSSPAVARDGSGYAGIEAGVAFPRDSDANVDTIFTTTNAPVVGTVLPPSVPAGPSSGSLSKDIRTK